VWIAMLNGSSPLVLDRMESKGKSRLWLCDVVKAELLFGAYKSKHQATNFAKLRDLFATFQSLPFNEASAWELGDIRNNLSQRGQLIGTYDMQIAAIARANQMTLVTANTREFMRVENLTIEDWSNPIINHY
jgi:tRNA(fMet)-specific endonuclease VapC